MLRQEGGYKFKASLSNKVGFLFLNGGLAQNVSTESDSDFNKVFQVMQQFAVECCVRWGCVCEG